MALLTRVQYVLQSPSGRERTRWWPVGLLALLVPLGIWLSSAGTAVTEEGERRAEEGSPQGSGGQLQDERFSEALKRSARLAVTLELTSLHWRGLEQDRGHGAFAPLVESLARDLRKGLADNAWRVTFLPPEPAGPERKQLDPSEKEALAEVRAGKNESWRQTASGETRYVRAIRATEDNCVVCHAAAGSPPSPKDSPLKINDILAVASLTLAGGENDAKAARDALPVSSDRPGILVQNSPYRVRPFDLLTVKVLNTLLDYPIDRVYLVEPNGQAALGVPYGRVQLTGLTIEETEEAIRTQLRKVLSNPVVQVTSAGRVTKWRSAVLPEGPHRIQPNESLAIRVAGTLFDLPIDGVYTVEPNGMLPLGPAYGRVRLSGLTLEQAESALKEHLLQTLVHPEAFVAVLRWKALQRDADTPGAKYCIAPGDFVEIDQMRMGTALGSHRMSGVHLVDMDGRVALQGSRGTVEIKGLTPEEAETAIKKHFADGVDDVRLAGISVTLAGWKQEARDRRGELGSRPAVPSRQAADVPHSRDRPTEPYRIRPFDLLTIKALNTFQDHPIDQTYFVGPAGEVTLGVSYGKVPLKGLTLEEAEGAITEHLGKILHDPKVQVTWAGRVTRWHSVTVRQAPDHIVPPTFLKLQVTGTLTDQPIDGRFLVDPEGQIALGPAYGRVNVKGLSVEEAEKAIEKHLQKTLKEPKVLVSLIPERRIVVHDVLPTAPHRITRADLLDIEVLNTLPDFPIRGTHLLEGSGELALGPAYGRVQLSGLTLEEAKAAIEKHLKKVLREPVVSVTLAGWKSYEEETTEERLRIRRLEDEVQRLKTVIQRLGGPPPEPRIPRPSEGRDPPWTPPVP